MPRPGPRPYECVRRAWHSDRHLPIRGSLIQHIFRVVNDSHSTPTKTNREWQEKLPIVVLKAEEIIYSKANSEEEYTNLETLWDRLKDAIDTIIRRDESSESGDLLPPCVEAALNLGCIPVRASRSQRHNNPRCYLTPRPQDPIIGGGDLSRNPDVPMNCLPPCRPDPMLSPNQMHGARLETLNSGLMVEKHSLAAASAPPPSFPLFYDNSSSCRGDRAINVDASRAPDLGTAYPLYHGIHFRSGEVRSVSDSPRGNANTILVGRPVGTSGAEPKLANVTQDLLSQESLESRSNFCGQMDYVKMGKRLSAGEKCDLSLRLSLSPSEPPVNVKSTLDCESEDDDSWGSLEDSMLSASPMENSQEFCFFPRGTMASRLHEHAPCK